ncbi:MAG: N-6 DNA methylase [Verrucomicrobia bacterium]|nr:N-6 DNA methylase [Verrucomicrobiota bacterium]
MACIRFAPMNGFKVRQGHVLRKSSVQLPFATADHPATLAAMPKVKSSESKSNGAALNFEAQLWAAAEQAVPAPHCRESEDNCARPEGLCLGLIFLNYISDACEEKREQLLFGFSDPKSEWFIKDEPQRADAAENQDFSLSASDDAPCSRERERVVADRVRDVGGKHTFAERAGVRCRIPRNADSFRQDLHPDLKADFILANPPFNMSYWGGENLRQDSRWKFGMPAVRNPFSQN